MIEEAIAPLEQLLPALDSARLTADVRKAWLLGLGARDTEAGSTPSFLAPLVKSAAHRGSVDPEEVTNAMRAMALVVDAGQRFMSKALWPYPPDAMRSMHTAQDFLRAPVICEMAVERGPSTLLGLLSGWDCTNDYEHLHRRLVAPTNAPFADLVVRHLCIERVAHHLKDRPWQDEGPNRFGARRLGGLRTETFLRVWPWVHREVVPTVNQERRDWRVVLDGFVSMSPLTQLVYFDVVEPPAGALARGEARETAPPSPLRPPWKETDDGRPGHDRLERWLGRLADSLVAAVASPLPMAEELNVIDRRLEKVPAIPRFAFERLQLEERARSLDSRVDSARVERLQTLANALRADVALHLMFLEKWYAHVLASSVPAMQQLRQKWAREGKVPAASRFLEPGGPIYLLATEMLRGPGHDGVRHAELGRLSATILQPPHNPAKDPIAAGAIDRLRSDDRFRIPLDGRPQPTRAPLETLEGWSAYLTAKAEATGAAITNIGLPNVTPPAHDP